MSLLRNRSNLIVYTINKNIKNNLNISVENGEVVVTAPWYLSKEQITNIVEEKRRWILEKIKEYEEVKKYENCEIVKILGKEYIVKLNYKNIKTLEVNLEEEIVKINLPNKYKKADKKEISKLLIEKMYYTIAEKEIEAIMEKTRKLLGFAPEDYKIQIIEGQIAKCTEDKVIVISPDIVKFTREEIEYIILHEFCHLKYKNHTRKFYELLKKYEPNYEKFNFIKI